MEAYDILMIAVLGLAILFGAWKGLAWQVASLTAIFVSYLVAMRFRGELAPYIQAQEPWNLFLAMFVLYLGTSLAVWIAFGFVRRFIEQFHLKDFDRHAGAVLGAVKGGLLCMVITLFAVTLLGERQKEAICRSRAGGYIARAINQLNGIVPPEIHSVLNPYLDKFNQEMTEHTRPQEPPFPSAVPYTAEAWPQTSGAMVGSPANEYRGQLTVSEAPAGQPVWPGPWGNSGEGGTSWAPGGEGGSGEDIRRVTDAILDAARNGLFPRH